MFVGGICRSRLLLSGRMGMSLTDGLNTKLRTARDNKTLKIRKSGMEGDLGMTFRSTRWKMGSTAGKEICSPDDGDTGESMET